MHARNSIYIYSPQRDRRQTVEEDANKQAIERAYERTSDWMKDSGTLCEGLCMCHKQNYFHTSKLCVSLVLKISWKSFWQTVQMCVFVFFFSSPHLFSTRFVVAATITTMVSEYGDKCTALFQPTDARTMATSVRKRCTRHYTGANWKASSHGKRRMQCMTAAMANTK